MCAKKALGEKLYRAAVKHWMFFPTFSGKEIISKLVLTQVFNSFLADNDVWNSDFDRREQGYENDFIKMSWKFQPLAHVYIYRSLKWAHYNGFKALVIT